MSSTSATLVDGRPITDRVGLHSGNTITTGRYRLLYREDTPLADEPDSPLDDLTVMHLAGPENERYDTAPIALPEGRPLIIGRDPARADILLSHPRVSRLHARIERQGAGAVIIDSSSSNGTFVDGRRLSGGTTLQPGSRIDIGPFALIFDGSMLIAGSRSNNLELVANGISRFAKSPNGRVALLDEISLVVWPREFVALLGPTGAGKSTLLDALGGRSPTDEGRVLINGQDLHACFDALKQDMALVPQHATLHDGLTLDQALYATARLRLPRDTSFREIASRVDSILRAVGLADRRGLRIGKLSGGQRRRAALANEVLNQPNLLFLDEVTSGLDEQADREMMRLFRTFADAGKTVVCVTHTLANLENNCHLVVFLTPGGKLAFVGTPSEALTYFGVGRLGDVYEKLLDPETTPAEWKARFEASSFHAHYVAGRLAGRCESRVSPATAGLVPLRERIRTFASQLRILLYRSILVQIADLRASLMAIGQALTVATILFLLFRDVSVLVDPIETIQTTRKLLFLMAISSVWFGCNNAAREIVRERTIYRRERDVNLQAGSYYASKLVLLGATSMIQVALLLGLVLVCCRPPIEVGTTTVLLGFLGLAGVSLGLLISSAARTEAIAASLVPIVLIPQIVLAGLIAPLSGVALWVARVCVTTYWGYHGLTHVLTGNLADVAPGEGPGPWAGLMILILHCGLLGAVTLFILRSPEGLVGIDNPITVIRRALRSQERAGRVRRAFSGLVSLFSNVNPQGTRR
jgi:ABC-type multidrug transport system ATPase subunit/pSer/pThr/pTyr-binding forkhead associated (FHA) protein